jgi:hypothetical protein
MTDVQEVHEVGRPKWISDDGVTEETQVVDYWSGPPEPVRWYFPDGKQWIAFSKMTHGQRSAYNARTSKELTLEKVTGNARVKADVAGDTNILIDVAVIDWYILRGGNPVSFSKGSPGSNLAQWMGQADPVLVDDLEKAIRKANPWLNAELTVKDIDEQIEELNREREEAVKREQGK